MNKEELSEILNWLNRLELAVMDASNAMRELLISGDRQPIVSIFAALQTMHGRPDRAINEAYTEAKDA